VVVASKKFISLTNKCSIAKPVIFQHDIISYIIGAQRSAVVASAPIGAGLCNRSIFLPDGFCCYHVSGWRGTVEGDHNTARLHVHLFRRSGFDGCTHPCTRQQEVEAE
jgi:hypothetical protein